MKIVSSDKVIYTFDKRHKPVEYVDIGETIVLDALDALGGQIKSKDDTLEKIDWSKVNPATGPIYINDAEKGDTLVVDILDIEIPDVGIGLVTPGYGVLGDYQYKSTIKFIDIKEGCIEYNGVKLVTRPMIGTIGVAPDEEPYPTAIPYKHGGNLDCKEVTKGAKLYLPVSTEGALFAAGDLHAVQADGELCVAAVEVPGRMTFKFDLIKEKQPNWPVIEYNDHYSILTSDENLENAIKFATKEAVDAIMRATGWSFEETYIFSSLAVDIRINQVVDPKKGARAVIPKTLISLRDLLR